MVSAAEDERARVAAEAAAWLARLQGDHGEAADREATDRGLQDWLRADPAHSAAFERATELWEMLPGAAAISRATEPANDVAPHRRSFGAVAASWVAALALAGGGALWLTAAPTLATHAGEQKVTALADGSTVALNTDSKVTIDYSAAERRIRLDRGEAMFDVAHNATRPFIVVVGKDEVRALGTSFVVRRDGDRLAVTLIRGKVELSHRGERPVRLATLAPGERATLVADAPAVTPHAAIDRPSVEAVTAWRRGEIVFDNVRLADAVGELNRYGGVPILVSDPHVAELRVSGVFETSDVNEFADAIAQLNRLRLVQNGDSVELRR